MVSPEFRLLIRALSAPEEATSLDDDDGRTANIARDPGYPGAVRAQLEGIRGSQMEHWRLPPAATRPTFYPAGVAFVPEAMCTAQLSEGSRTVIWRSPSPGAMDDPMPDSLRETLDRMKQDLDASGSGQREQSVESIAASLADPAALEWASRLIPSEPGASWDSAYDHLVAESVKAGWEPADDSGPSRLNVGRMVTLSRDGFERIVILISTLGICSLQQMDRRVD